MHKYPNSPPTPVNGLDYRDSTCGAVYCGSFALLLHISDRGRPAISIVMLSTQQDQASLAKVPEFGTFASIPKSDNRVETISALEQASRPSIHMSDAILARDEQQLR